MATITEEGSSSGTTSDKRYDIFLSFRGVDTRNNFTDHLHKELKNSGFKTFLDDEEIQTGEELKPELVSAIKASRASIIVLSENYASSTWCLVELVLILEQLETSNHIVIPVFFHVEPTNIRKRQKSFGDALAKHRESIEKETDRKKKIHLAGKMESWENALTQVAGLKGTEVTVDRRETLFIDEIVEDVRNKLGTRLKGALPKLFGRDSSIEFIISWLEDGSSYTADILTITGMAGIGKTSLAKYVFYAPCGNRFDRRSFVEDIGRRCTPNSDKILDSQKMLFDDISKSSQSEVRDKLIYTRLIEDALSRQKVFIVLDDIYDYRQLDALLGNKGFYPGSKIIITTKQMSLTENCTLFKKMQPKHSEHLLKVLQMTDSLHLLSYHAFGRNHLKEGYEEVSEKLVEYCEGLPLALEVLGGNLRGQDVASWKGSLKSLEKKTDDHIQNVLKLSFDYLPSEEDKELFKHIACFFVGENKNFIEIILTACGMSTEILIKNLLDRCLLTIGLNDELKMHQLVQNMGRDMVDQESSKPWKRSRLWRHMESFTVLKKRKGWNIKGLVLDMKMLEKERSCGPSELKIDAFREMDNVMK